MLDAQDQQKQEALKSLLQSDPAPGKLENLAAALLGNLLGVAIAVAKPGFQHGADAGPAGRQGRRLRIECKKYSEDSSLRERELLGEVDQAQARDPALEAWLLVATRDVPEQLEQALNKKAESSGVPIVILDFKASGQSSLAALCSHAPDLVAQLFSPQAGAHARALQHALVPTLDELKRDLEAWQLGFNSLRDRSLRRLEQIWNEPRVSAAALGQNAAGGALPQSLQRIGIQDPLNEWWFTQAPKDAPAALVGSDGVGKTWAGLRWLVDRQTLQPIVLVIPSSAVLGTTISEVGVKSFLAGRIYELVGVRDRDHWLRRLENLLRRPLQEGPTLTVFLDGLNQEPSIDWLLLLKVFQAPPFAGKVRVMVSTRQLHYDMKLAHLRGLVVPPVVVPVTVYDLRAGGELDQMLASQKLSREDLHGDLLEAARTPRLFRLIVKLLGRLRNAKSITVHRLLWEYGRDSVGDRAGKSFSEAEWRAWLRDVALQYREGVDAERDTYSLRALSETTSRPDLTEREVYARLSDIVDGRFAVPHALDEWHLSPAIVAHALGSALLSLLESRMPTTFESLDATLSGWLDPIADFDQRSEILRAAVSINIEKGDAASMVTGVLVTAWLQSQNITDVHRRELRSLASEIPGALLDAIEHSDTKTHASAKTWAIRALRSIDRNDEQSLTVLVDRLHRWCGIVSRDVSRRQQHAGFEKDMSKRFLSRIGTDASGQMDVIGVRLEFVDDDSGALALTAARLLEGLPLAKAGPVFEAAAVVTAIARRNDAWSALKWLVLLNENDPASTTTMLRELAQGVRGRTPESGVHPGLARRAAALLLWLSASESDDVDAAKLDPGLERAVDYTRDYLEHPAKSVFTLERRHAEQVLADTSLPLLFRVKRTKAMWLDPDFTPARPFVQELQEAAAAIDVNKLDGHIGISEEDHILEELLPVLARCAPDALLDLTQRKIQDFPRREANARYALAIHATSHFLVVGADESDAARQLRLQGREQSPTNEMYAASQLLILELKNRDAARQATSILEADLEEFLTDVAATLRPLAPAEADSLVSRYSSGSRTTRKNLLFLIAHDRVMFSADTTRWLAEVAFTDDAQLRGIAHRALTLADSKKFGGELLSRAWTWSAQSNHWENNYGSEALIEGATQVPFDQLAPRIAPWRLLEAARRRGADPVEVRLACTIMGRAIVRASSDLDPGAILSVDRSRKQGALFHYSVSPLETEAESIEPSERFRRAFDTEGQLRAYQQAADVACERIRLAREAGADFLLTDVSNEDLDVAILHCPDFVSHWLEGCEETTDDFVRRVNLAEGVFLSLCESLLTTDPPRGALLLRALRRSLRSQFIGPSGGDELMDIAFRAPDSPEADELQRDLVSLRECSSDQALLDLAVSATFNGKAQWLQSLIIDDAESPLEWRKRRSIVLASFMANNPLPVDGAWPEGEIKTDHEALRRRSQRFRHNEACAHYWWNVYLSAADHKTAYAAWILFMESADKRAQTWPSYQTPPVHADESRILHRHLNKARLGRAMKEREKNLDRQFLGRDIVDGVGPWASIESDS